MMFNSTIKYNNGITIIELLVVIVILGIIVSSALPHMSALVNKNRASAAILSLYSSLSLAQNESERQRTAISVKPINDTQWENGWEVFSDSNQDGTKNNDDKVLLYSKLDNEATLLKNNTNSNIITFLPGGSIMISNGLASITQFYACTLKQPTTNSTLQIHRSGNLLMNDDHEISCQ